MNCKECNKRAANVDSRFTEAGFKQRRYKCRCGHTFNTIELPIVDKSLDGYAELDGLKIFTGRRIEVRKDKIKLSG